LCLSTFKILIDWLVEVHAKFKLRTETLYLTVNIIDRFLQERSLSRSKLQLLGCTGMLLASKYEEIYAPEVRDLSTFPTTAAPATTFSKWSRWSWAF